MQLFQKLPNHKKIKEPLGNVNILHHQILYYVWKWISYQKTYPYNFEFHQSVSKFWKVHQILLYFIEYLMLGLTPGSKVPPCIISWKKLRTIVNTHQILLLIFDSYFKGKMDFLIDANDYFFKEISNNSVRWTLVQNNYLTDLWQQDL